MKNDPTNQSNKGAAKAPKPLTEAQLVVARDELFRLNAIMDEAKTEQLKIREYLAYHLAPQEEGACTVTVGAVKVTVTKELRRTITREEAERLVQEHGDLSLEVLRWTPEVRVKPYKEHADILDDYIVTKPSPPTVVFK